MKKGQFSMEFILIFTLVFFAFVLILALIAAYSDEQKVLSEEKRLSNMAKLVTDSVNLAATSGSDFETTFTLPAKLDSYDYYISIIDKDLLVINGPRASVESRLPQVEGSISQSCNRIVKRSGVISIGAC